jgi:tetratricopeptide (TPR) repeat protein
MSICEVHRQLGHHTQAIHYGQRALAITVDIGDPIGEGGALRDLGAVHLCLGDLDAAEDLLCRALVRMNDGYPYGQYRATSFLGEVRRRQGRLAEALELQHRAVAFFRLPDHRMGLATALTATALVHSDLGEHAAARELLEEAVLEAVNSGYRYDEAQAHAVLGDVLAAKDLASEARRHWAMAMSIFEELGSLDADRLRPLVTSSTIDS